ncbi:putative proline oxidase Put1 [Aspergillus fijiensis CBS 313.89]|uniref:Proline dehydrogenase n=1 Tax=Aspergillus fijiensis CBS 313.89 TaxID=1448319 RepID=A0A8G1VU16_9EURO|nr:FAD-linked oxidoreductase [Aspergillus fijiensis CBS 313.89]RAK72662.1 FAD-linked oxidoreductase [Aspergillus fijiensis CBS 313.89]
MKARASHLVSRPRLDPLVFCHRLCISTSTTSRIAGSSPTKAATTTVPTASGTENTAHHQHHHLHHHEIAFPATRTTSAAQPSSVTAAPLAGLPTRTFLRSLFLTSVMASPLLTPCLSLMKLLVDSPSKLLRPSSNAAMDYLLRRSIYDHFCAGTNEIEVRQTVREMKRLGFKGVILGYARESIAQVSPSSHQETIAAVLQGQLQQAQWEQAVNEWKEGNLRTLKMLGEGDYLAVKFTGAGPLAVHSLTRNDPHPPPQIAAAIHEICAAVAAQKSRLWIDAEQQVFQAAIDSWAVDLMRRFNRPSSETPQKEPPIVVLNTYQAYLKRSADILAGHLRLARQEGWGVGVKLVRGAYIAHDQRDRIWDTKEETDANYNGIVRALIENCYPSISRGAGSELRSERAEDLPTVRLFVASHNGESVAKACALYQQRQREGRKTIPVEVGQLQGMADEVSLGMVVAGGHAEAKPGVFKCLAWGSTEECLHFLLRRAVENQSAMQRTRDTAQALRGEAWRRMVALMRA